MPDNETLEPYTSGADMWREYVSDYGIITARVICNSYLGMHTSSTDPEEQVFCEQLREAMAIGLNTRNTDIYLWGEGIAKLDGKVEIYNASIKAFEQCAGHIDEAIHATVFGNGDRDCHYDLALAALVDHHGIERVEILLKCAVLYDLPFGRYSDDLYKWAKDFKKPEHFGNFGIRTRPAVLVGLVEEFRRQEAMFKMENQQQSNATAPEVSEVKTLIRFIDSEYREQFKIPDGESIRVTYPPGDGREPSERDCKSLGEMHVQIGGSTYHICQFAEAMERIDAKFEPVNQLQSIDIKPFTLGIGEDKFYSHNREEGHTCAGSLHGNFGSNYDGDRFSASWRAIDNGLYNGEIQSELQSVVYALRQDILKNRDSMIEYCQSNPDAKLLEGKLSSGDAYATYGFKLETESRQYFVNCFVQDRDSRFSVFAYADKPAPVLEQGQQHQQAQTQTSGRTAAKTQQDKASVLNEIRESRSAPKSPSKPKPEKNKTKKKNQQEH